MTEMLELSYQMLNQLQIEIDALTLNTLTKDIHMKLKEYNEILINLDVEYKMNKKNIILKNKINEYIIYKNKIQLIIDKNYLVSGKSSSGSSTSTSVSTISTENKYVYMYILYKLIYSPILTLTI